MRSRAGFLLAAALALLPAWASADSGNPGGANTATPTASPAATQTALPGQTSPFATPTPTPTPGPIGNGFVLFGINTGNGSGGTIPSATATPMPFPGSNESGFFIDVAGRFSPTYSAMLHFNDYALHGGDSPVVTRSDGALYYTPNGGAFAFGLGYMSLQRSSSAQSANAAGVGISLLPDLRRSLAPYVNLFFYPGAKVSGTTSAITTIQAGLMFEMPRSHLVFKLGYDHQSYGNQSTSPTSLGGVQFGVGAGF